MLNFLFVFWAILKDKYSRLSTMTNIPSIEIFEGVNDTPVEATSTAGSNGSAVVNRLNKVINKLNYPDSYPIGLLAPIEIYLDTIGGDDTNDGLTDTTAYRTWDKVLTVLDGGMTTSECTVIVYIRGTLQAPLDLRPLKSISYGRLYGARLTLDRFPSDTENWVLENLAYDENYYINPTAFITDRGYLQISINYCTFKAPIFMDFSGFNAIFYACMFSAFDTSEAINFNFTEGDFNLNSCGSISEGKPASLRFHGANCFANINSFSSDLAYDFEATFRATSGASVYPSGTFTEDMNMALIYDNGKVNFVPNGGVPNLAIEIAGYSEVRQLTGYNNRKYLSFYYPSIANNTELILAIFPFPVIIKALRYSLTFGSGTLHLELAGESTGISQVINGSGNIYSIDLFTIGNLEVPANTLINIRAALASTLNQVFLILDYEV